MHAIIKLTLLTSVCCCFEKMVLNDPFVIYSNDTVSILYDKTNANVSYIKESRGISIIFEGRIILNFFNDHRTIKDIGMIGNGTLNDIEIIPKPDFAALLEMVSDISNIQNIPWLILAMQCLSYPSSKRCRSVFNFSRGLHCDTDGHLIGVDLSHLNLTGNVHLKSLPPTVR